MAQLRKMPTPERQAQIRAELQRDRDLRQKGYRDQALKLFPHVCARCAREFSGKRLRELTVHHKDHDHNNNPPDGNNWELLCLYCHDHEHEKYKLAGYSEGLRPEEKQEGKPVFKPFENLDALLSPTSKSGKPPA